MKVFGKILVVLMIVTISSPYWMMYFPVISIDTLSGSYIKKEKEDLTLNNWSTVKYQEALEQSLLLDNYLSPIFIKIYNQIDYTFFNILHMSEGVLGKHNYIYQQGYIDAYLGKDTIGKAALNDFAYKFKVVSDTLKKLNKHILYIQCPGKASYFPEYLPDSILKKESVYSNYFSLLKVLDTYGVEYIDFKKYFLEQKNKTPYPLFTQTGIHWSEYSMPIVMDSIINYCNATYNYSIPNIKISKVKEGQAKGLDKDLEVVMNLLFKIPGPTYGYSEVEFPKSKTNDVTLLLVADSYLGNVYWSGFHHFFSNRSQFWFYNKSVFGNAIYNDVHILQLNYVEEALRHDLIIVGATEPGIRGNSWQFIDNMYYFFTKGIKISEENTALLNEIHNYKKTLVSKRSIQQEVENLAQKHHISYDSALFVKAAWDVEKKSFNVLIK